MECSGLDCWLILRMGEKIPGVLRRYRKGGVCTMGGVSGLEAEAKKGR